MSSPLAATSVATNVRVLPDLKWPSAKSLSLWSSVSRFRTILKYFVAIVAVRISELTENFEKCGISLHTMPGWVGSALRNRTPSIENQEVVRIRSCFNQLTWPRFSPCHRELPCCWVSAAKQPHLRSEDQISRSSDDVAEAKHSVYNVKGKREDA